ncbi:MAG: Wzz/FepE/Etk N-terminal domain-containing protein [Ignavibacteria bacterium]
MDKNLKNSIVINNIKILLRYKKFISIATLIIVLAVSFVVFFVLDPIFYSSATVKASSKMSGIGNILGSSMPDIGGLDELSGGGSASKELALYSQIIYSRRCLEEVIIKFNLMEEYNQKYMERTLKLVKEQVVEVGKDTKSGTLEIGVYDNSPQRAKEMADFLVEQLNKINTELNVLNAKNNREFLENRYNLIKKDLTQAEDSLKNFQEIYGLAPDVTAKAIVQSQVQLEVELSTEEIKMELLRKMLSPEQSEVKMQEQKIASLKKQITDIKNSDSDDRLLRLKGAPNKITSYLRLLRNVEIQNKLLIYILPMYEQSKVEEKKETPTVLILDKPYLPELKKKPKRMTIIGLSLFLSLGLLSFSVLVYENIGRNLISSFNQRND